MARRSAASIRPVEADTEYNSRLVQHTGWQPRHSLEDGLRLTIEWMRDHLKDYRVDDYVR